MDLKKVGVVVLVTLVAVPAWAREETHQQSKEPSIAEVINWPRAERLKRPEGARVLNGFSTSYLEQVAAGTHRRPMLSRERARELLNQRNSAK